MHHVSCIMHHASCIMHHVSCIMHHASCIMELLTLRMIKVTKDDGPFKLMMTTLITHDGDQGDMHEDEDVGSDDYVDSDALMMITIASIMMMTPMVMVIMMMMSMTMKMLHMCWP